MIQRFDFDEYGNMAHRSDGYYMTYADHVAALANAAEVTDAQVEAGAIVAGEWCCGSRDVKVGASFRDLARSVLTAARAVGGA